MLERNVDAAPLLRNLRVTDNPEYNVAYSIGPVECEEGDHVKLNFQVTVVNPSRVHNNIQAGCFIVKSDSPDDVNGERITTFRELTVAPKSQQVLDMQREDDISVSKVRIYYNFVVYAISSTASDSMSLDLKGKGYGEASIRIKKNVLLQQLTEQQERLEQQQKEIEDIQRQLEDERNLRMGLEFELQQVETQEQIEQAEINGLQSQQKAEERELQKVEQELKRLEDQPAPVSSQSLFRR